MPPALDTLATLALTTPEGAATTLGAQLRPGPAIVSFWATWCAPCVAEARHLAMVRARYSPEQLNIVGVNVDRNRDEARVAEFLQRGRVNDTQTRGDLTSYQSFGAGAQIVLPRLYIFSADGHPVATFGRYNGGATLRAIDRAVSGVVR